MAAILVLPGRQARGCECLLTVVVGPVVNGLPLLHRPDVELGADELEVAALGASVAADRPYYLVTGGQDLVRLDPEPVPRLQPVAHRRLDPVESGVRRPAAADHLHHAG